MHPKTLELRGRRTQHREGDTHSRHTKSYREVHGEGLGSQNALGVLRRDRGRGGTEGQDLPGADNEGVGNALDRELAVLGVQHGIRLLFAFTKRAGQDVR